MILRLEKICGVSYPLCMHRIYIHILIILTMAVSALSPSGYMPNFDENGFSINICAGGVFKSQIIDRNNPQYETLRLIHEAQNPDAIEMQNGCEYSFFAFAALLPENFIVTDFIVMRIHNIISVQYLDILRNAGMPPPSTGPPSL